MPHLRRFTINRNPKNHVMRSPAILVLADMVLSKVLVPEIREVGLGDLWEAHSKLRRKGTNVVLSNIITIWRGCLLIKASIQIYYDNRHERRKQKYSFPENYTYLPYFFEPRRHKRKSNFFFSLIMQGVVFHVITGLTSIIFPRMPQYPMNEDDTSIQALPFSIDDHKSSLS